MPSFVGGEAHRGGRQQLPRDLAKPSLHTQVDAKQSWRLQQRHLLSTY
jgi:hypothetical protein